MTDDRTLRPRVRAFVVESNRIEGITRKPTTEEVDAHLAFLKVDTLTVEGLAEFVETVAGADLRDRSGMNVRVGGHIPTPGGSHVLSELRALLAAICGGELDPYEAHVAYETLHPFMDGNGRSGRVVWAWQMVRSGRDPFALPFLQRWYYDSLGRDRTMDYLDLR